MLAGLDDTGFDPIAAGGVIDYVVDIANNGTDAAPATTLTFSIPAGTTLVGTSGDLSNCLPTSGSGALDMTCDVPAMAADSTISQTVQVSAAGAGVITVSAEIPTSVGATTDSNVGNNIENETTTIQTGADIGLSLTVDPTAASGSVVDFVLEATNNGPDASNAFTIQFPAPTGVVNMSPGAGCFYSAPNWVCNIAGPIASGASVTRTFSGQISAGSGSTIAATASVIGQNPTDPISSNNSDVGNLTVTQGTDVAISKTRSPGGTLLIGDSVTFTLAASYTGDAPTGLTIEDSVPSNYSITAVNTVGAWSCTTTGQDVSCTNPGGGAAGSNVSLGSVDIVADVVSSGSALNTATISAAAVPPEQNLANNTDTDGGVTIAEPVVDFQAHKTGPNPQLAVVGNSYDYDIYASHNGNSPFWGTLELHDTLPAGLDLTSITQNGWTCSQTNGAGPLTVDCTRVYTEASPLSAGATTPAVTFHTTVSASGLLSNVLTVGSSGGNIADTNADNDGANYDVQAEFGAGSADIVAIKTASSDPVVAGDILTYTLEVTNADTTTALDIEVSDLISNLMSSGSGPTGAGFIDASIAAGVATGVACSDSAFGSNARNLSCTIDSLPTCTAGNDCPVITIRVRPGGNGGTYTNTFSAISQTTPDPDLTNNQASASYDLDPRADVAVTKTATPNPATAGQDLVYVVTAQNLNNGLSQAEGVEIVDTLPDDLTFVSASGATCIGLSAGDVTSGSTLTCDMGTISNGGQRAVTITVRPNDVLQGTTITNDVTVSTTTTEIDGTNNSASIAVDVNDPVLDLQINKTDSVDPVAIGDDTVYTITVTNNGPSASENVVMTDSLPGSLLSYQSFTVSGAGICGTVPAVDSIGGTVECTWPRLEKNQSETVTVTMRGVAKGTVPNSAVVSSDEVTHAPRWEGPDANNTIDEDTTVRTKTDVQLTKTSSAPEVELLEDFTFTLLVDVNTGAGLAEADDVTVSDNLPANMELIGAPSAVVNSGTASSNSCTGVAGSTSFSCDFGTVSSGAQVEITVPVQVTAASSDPYTRTNTATVTTSSLDTDPTNNSDDDVVNVVFSSLAGTVFRDFADDAEMNGTDTGISGVTMTLTGTDFDGNAISRTTTTDSNGDYIFTILPRGTYQVNRGAVSEAHLTDSDALTPAPSEGGTYNGFTEINTIRLPRDTDAIEYNFALIPMARVGISKEVTGTVAQHGDGSFSATFSLVVENFSLEPLINIEVTDPLAGANPLFGALATPANPVSDAMSAGTYAIIAAPSGSCSGLNAGFDGDGDTVVASGFSLPVGGNCTLAFTIRVQPEEPVPAGYENQAVVDAEGQDSGQTPPSNPQLHDLSDDGANPDTDGDGQGNEPGENDPTPVAPGVNQASISLIKTVDTSLLPDPVMPGDVITYKFEVENTGNMVLTNVTVTDALPGVVLVGGPIPVMNPGDVDTTTYSATYTVTDADAAAHEVVNNAQVVGTYGPNPGDEVYDFDSKTVEVGSIEAIPEVFPPFIGDGGGTTTSMLASDLLNEGPATLDNVTLRVLNEDPGVTLDPTTALITLAPGYPAGEYHVEYEICSIAIPTMCDTTIETVVQGLLPGIEKTTPRDVVKRGDIVPYTITVTNPNGFVLTPADIVDILPAHFLPLAESAQLDGVDFNVDVSGLRVTWPNVSIPANGSVTATLDARVLNGAPAGEHVNKAWVYNGRTGDLIAGVAEASVRILPEFVFDCSDVIGVVFDDHNANGYKDGVAEDPQAMHENGITDQSYYGGKLGKLGPVLPEAERGIPGVRLVSPDGTIVTTDENGLYSVPCAALPAGHGSNFILKLDERSLPSGYRPTTENPRVVRLTPGMMAEVNFGASIGKVVRVDLIEAAFVAGETGQGALSPELEQGIRTLVAKFADEPVIVRLAWHVAASADASAVKHGRARMQLVETRLRQEWAAAGHVPLRVETTIVRAGQ